MEQQYNTAQLPQQAKNLRAGQRILLSGIVYTARDAAHGRIWQAMEKGDSLPFDLKGACIYYAGPTPTPPGMAIGACGPTTSGRMDSFTPRLMDQGLICTIGKGKRSPQVTAAIERNQGVYLCALGGAAALAAACVESCRVIAYEDLGCESVKELVFRDFPLIVAIDSQGGNLFEQNGN